MKPSTLRDVVLMLREISPSDNRINRPTERKAVMFNYVAAVVLTGFSTPAKSKIIFQNRAWHFSRIKTDNFLSVDAPVHSLKCRPYIRWAYQVLIVTVRTDLT